MAAFPMSEYAFRLASGSASKENLMGAGSKNRVNCPGKWGQTREQRLIESLPEPLRVIFQDKSLRP